MAKQMTKSNLVRLMAEKMELTNEKTSAFFDILSETAAEETRKNGKFTIPGIVEVVQADGKHNFMFISKLRTRAPKPLTDILKARETALDAGGKLVSLETLDARLADKKRKWRRAPQMVKQKTPRTVSAGISAQKYR